MAMGKIDVTDDGTLDRARDDRGELEPYGFDCRLVVSYRPRRGPRGFFGRTIFRRAVRALEETVENLGRRFEERRR
jgi:hypothetical protein